MGVSVNSAGSTTGAVAMAGTLTIKNANKDSRARIEYVCGKSKSSGTKKKLNYNYKEVSNQLLRAKKPQGAANALTKAKSRLATLQRYAATGEYDSKEISAAVAHARRMVECAQLKVRHLKQEEIENRKYKSENKSEATHSRFCNKLRLSHHLLLDYNRPAPSVFSFLPQEYLTPMSLSCMKTSFAHNNSALRTMFLRQTRSYPAPTV